MAWKLCKVAYTMYTQIYYTVVTAMAERAEPFIESDLCVQSAIAV